MPLKIELKPNERLIIGNAAIRNGERRASFVLETNTRFLRESEIIPESEADTPCKQLYVLLQVMYLVDHPFEAETAFMALANDVMQAVPSMGPRIAAIHEATSTGERYKALKLGRALIAYEQEVRGRAPASEPPAA
ncbi:MULTISPECIES: flagellar biosynthesis repressor FlbT [Methylobacterium]|uniref:Flagellum biosynthesis repressor protein FlbT n=1 Tax=Methylobacterium thuringiense TaxID=1003091 RepID=A0ABQ4TJR1_9HYPH|nr:MULTISPECIES: flagellar biosynthesis repressor FlbT [Methylobacterium]TXN21475.1 flagellar protein FlbT [Methylobacterium sp. WL9]GJE55146.1 flagellum biosynthesis repressor protein FlbT [Methylobacterium thuringiense]